MSSASVEDGENDTPPRLSVHAAERIRERLSTGEPPETYLARQWPTRSRVRRTGKSRALYHCRNCELIVDEQAQVVITVGPPRFWSNHTRKARIAQEGRLRQQAEEWQGESDHRSDQSGDWFDPPIEPELTWDALRRAAARMMETNTEEIEGMVTASSVVKKYVCLRCNEEKPESAYQLIGRQHSRSRFCRPCLKALQMQGMAEARRREAGDALAAVVTPPPTPLTTPVVARPQQDDQSAVPALLDHLMQARVDIMNLRDWLDWDNERTAILCGADLFIRAGKAGVWVLRPDGSDVPEPITPKIILALAGSREGLVFW